MTPDQVGKHAKDPIDLKLLVITPQADPVNDPDFGAITAFLNQLGVPFNTLVATQTQLTPNLLWDGGVHGYYQGVILTNSNLTYFDPATGTFPSAFNSAEWQTLWTYEATFNVRQVTSFTGPFGYPDLENYGLAVSYNSQNTPLQASLTADGASVYSYLRPTTPIQFQNQFAYLTTIANPANTTPLLVTPAGNVIASVHTYSDGRQNLAVTSNNNANFKYSMLLSYGTINWVTKGLFLGQRHVQLDTTSDDLFIDDNMWDPATLSDLNDANNYRLTGNDLQALVNWQNGLGGRFSLAAGAKVEWAFNGQGTEPGLYPAPDTLTPAVAASQASFNFVNHTYTHLNLDSATYQQVLDELSKNNHVAHKMGFDNYWKDAFVQPDISGMSNPNFQQAAVDFGIRYMISDTSQKGWNNPSPNAGFYSSLQPSLLIIPRRPTNLFYNLRTPAQWVSEYNCYYGPLGGGFPGSGTCANGTWRFWDHDLSYAEILDKESEFMLGYMLRWDIDPLMFHQPNMAAYDGTHSLYSDLMDAVFTKYSAVYNLPILNHPEHQIGLDMSQRMAYNASGVTASMVPCQSLTITTPNAAVVPVTGLANGPGGATETYGGQKITYLKMTAGQAVTVPISC